MIKMIKTIKKITLSLSLKQLDDSDESQQESDFDIVKNKLVHIGDTSRTLVRKADAAAEDI